MLSAEQAAVAIAAAAMSFLIISSQRIEVSAQLTSFRLFETLCTVIHCYPLSVCQQDRVGYRRHCFALER